MKPASVVSGVFKALLLSTMLMIIVGSAVNIWNVFNTQKKIDAIGTAMATELSKNNAILYDSVNGFGEQLVGITDISKGMYQLQSVSIDNGNALGDVTILNADVKKVVDIDTAYTTDFTNLYEGKINEYYSATQGKYGEFATLKLTYYVIFDIYSWKNSNLMLRRNIIGRPVTFEYKVPCLRYMK